MKYLKNVAKALFVVGLLYFLSQKGFISAQETRKAFDHWPELLGGFVALGTMMILGAVRWRWLLEAQGIRIPFLRVLELSFVGNFFNIALPGAVSGDFVKAFYIGKELPGKRARAFGSILFDRVAGLAALVLVSAVAMLMGSSGSMASLKPYVLLCICGEVFFFCYLFFVREHRDPVLMFLRQIEKKIVKMGAITRIYEGLRHYHHHRMAVLKSMVLSVFIHLWVGWAILQFASALGSNQLPVFGVYTIFPIGLLITAVPVAPAGVGTGHAAFSYLFHLIGSERGADIFTLYALSNIIYGAIGGLIYLRFRDVKTTVPNGPAPAPR